MNIEKVTQADLTALKGKNLWLWHFTPSKDMLTYNIPGEYDKFLIFLLCETITTHVIWKVDNPKLTRIVKYLFKVEDAETEIVFQEIIFNNEYRISD